MTHENSEEKRPADCETLLPWTDGLAAAVEDDIGARQGGDGEFFSRPGGEVMDESTVQRHCDKA